MKAIISTSTSVLIMIGFAIFTPVFAQPPEIEWTREHGGDNVDMAFSVQQTSDGGYAFAGYTTSFNADSNDVYLGKTDSLGNLQWQQHYGGYNYEDARSVQQTSDGGYIVAGRTQSYSGLSNDMYVVKTDSQGDTLWIRIYRGTNSSAAAQSVQQTDDGGYVIAGYSSLPYLDNEMFLVKIDSLGDTLWTRTYGGSDDRTAHCVRQTRDGGYILAGDNHFHGGVEYDIYLVKTDSMGNLHWTGTYGGNDTDRARSVRQTTEGGYIIAGSTDSFGADRSDVYVVKTDSLGDTLWTRTFGGSDFDFAQEVQQTLDGGYIIAGSTSSYGAGGYDLYMIKINTVGDTIWTLVYGGLYSDKGYSVDLTDDGGYIVAGVTQEYWEEPADCWLVKIGPDTAVSGAPSIQWVSHPKDYVLHPAYPNPFNPVTTISYDVPVQGIVQVDIYNVLGQKTAELVNGIKIAGHHQLLWDAGELPSGIYFIQMESGEFQQVQKIVLLK